MKKLILIAVLALAGVGCGKMDAALESTLGMADKMNVMTESTRLLKVGEGMKLLFLEDNTQNPDLPLMMFPGGKLIADHATLLELIELVYIWSQDVNQVAPLETKKGANGKYPKDYMDDFNHFKAIRVAAIRVVASLTPQDKVQKLIEEQINSGGRYENTTYMYLMARARYLHDILIRLDLLETEKMSNLGIIEEAYIRAANLKFILGLPFRDKLVMDMRGFINEDGNRDPELAVMDKVDPAEFLGTIADVKRKANQELDAKWKSNPRYPTIKAKIDSL
jgi:hypothetical protein